jgi:hypothetical protein
MQRKRLAWILLPAVIILIAVVTFVLSSYQKEVGIAEPGKGARVTVAAAVEAQNAASGMGAEAYDVFSKSLTVALAEADHMAVTNPAETRLQTDLNDTLDCLKAVREVWQAQLEADWDPAVDGSPRYWVTLHPGLSPSTQTTGLTTDQVRQWTGSSASYWLDKALALIK